jgi:hypothetical protein
MNAPFGQSSAPPTCSLLIKNCTRKHIHGAADVARVDVNRGGLDPGEAERGRRIPPLHPSGFVKKRIDRIWKSEDKLE